MNRIQGLTMALLVGFSACVVSGYGDTEARKSGAKAGKIKHPSSLSSADRGPGIGNQTKHVHRLESASAQAKPGNALSTNGQQPKPDATTPLFFLLGTVFPELGHATLEIEPLRGIRRVTLEIERRWGIRHSTLEVERSWGLRQATIEVQPLQACCMPDVSCQNLDVESCIDQNGAPAGWGNLCLGVEACCMSDGSCSELDAQCCVLGGGQPRGPGSVCEALEACCLAGQDCMDLAPTCCVNLAGTSLGVATSCQATEACCFPGGPCENLEPQCCQEAGGFPRGIGSQCLGDLDGNNRDDACGCGKCALYADVFPAPPDGNCVVDLDDILRVLSSFSVADQCGSFPGTDLFPCDPQPRCALDTECPIGFMCDAAGDCCRLVDLDDILAVLAAFAGTFGCDHPCSPGACCFDDGTCQDWDTLPPGDTPPGGISLSTCIDLGGRYAGDGLVCIGDQNQDGSDDVCR